MNLPPGEHLDALRDVQYLFSVDDNSPLTVRDQLRQGLISLRFARGRHFRDLAWWCLHVLLLGTDPQPGRITISRKTSYMLTSVQFTPAAGCADTLLSLVI